MFVKNISNNSKSSSSKSNQSKKKKKKKIFNYLKNGFLDYSLDSNSILSCEDQESKMKKKAKKLKKTKISF